MGCDGNGSLVPTGYPLRQVKDKGGVKANGDTALLSFTFPHSLVQMLCLMDGL